MQKRIFLSFVSIRVRSCFIAFLLISQVGLAQSELVDDMKTVRERFVLSLIPPTAPLVQDLIGQARQHEQRLVDDGTWPDLDYADRTRARWPLGEHLNRTLLMAKASHALRAAGKPDQQLDGKIVSALDWWLEHDPKNPNWWWNEIGVPQFLGEIALMVRPELSQQQVDRIIEMMKRSKWEKWTGQNLVWGTGIQVLRGLLEENQDTVAAAHKRMYEEIRIVPQEQDGIQADFSFHQHGQQLYNGGYGLGFGNDVGRFIAHAWGTQFQIPRDKLDIYLSYLLDGQRWMIVGDVFDYSAVGREIVRPGKVAVNRKWTTGPISPAGAAYGMGNVVRQLSQLDLPRKDQLEAFASSLSQGRSDFSGNKHFWCSDYMVHRRAGWMMSIKMFSTRMINAELINEEGKKSHHLSDGATFIYRSGDEYKEIFPVWDWQKIPGTTAEQNPDGNLDRILPKGNHARGETSFVGGVSNGSIGLAAMDVKRGKLRAKKAWFCFDDCVVCLGAGITCEGTNNVVTCVNQSLLHGDVKKSDDGKSLWHDGIGYFFLNRTKCVLSDAEQSGRLQDVGAQTSDVITKRVFKLAIDHGASPHESKYAYSIAPGASTKAPSPTIIAHDEKVQAVAAGGTVAAVFWSAGAIDEIEVDRACLLLLDRSTGRVSVANPENQPAVVTVKVTGHAPIRVELPDGLEAGSTVTVKLPE
jgi:chondroitin AC lyase